MRIDIKKPGRYQTESGDAAQVKEVAPVPENPAFESPFPIRGHIGTHATCWKRNGEHCEHPGLNLASEVKPAVKSKPAKPTPTE